MRGGDRRFRSKKGVNAAAKQLNPISDGHPGESGWQNGVSYSFDLAGSNGFVKRQ
jgi:hypothetical protein